MAQTGQLGGKLGEAELKDLLERSVTDLILVFKNTCKMMGCWYQKFATVSSLLSGEVV
jgi:hypothetical protein